MRSDKFVQSLESLGIEIRMTSFGDTEPDQLPRTPQDDVILKGTSIAVIKDSDNNASSIVIFRPSTATRAAAKTYEGQDVALHLSDENGLFTPRSPQRITGSVYEPGNNTMIVYTENQA